MIEGGKIYDPIDEEDFETFFGFGSLVVATGLAVASVSVNNYALAHHIPYLESAVKSGVLPFLEKSGVLGLAVMGYVSIFLSTGPHSEPGAGGHDSI